MLKFELISIYFVLVILIACNNPKINEGSHCLYNANSPTKEIVITKELHIPIDSTNNFMSTQTIVKGDSLIRENYFTTAIDIFSIKRQKRIKQYRFKGTGPNRVIRFGGAGIVPLERNSFLMGNLIGEVYITHNDSVLYRENLANKNMFDGKEYWLYGINQLKPIRIGDEVFFSRVPQYSQENKLHFKSKLMIKFNIKTKSLTELNVVSPKEYHTGLWSFAHIHPSFTLNNKSEIIYSFPISSNLHKYNIKLDTLLAINKCVKSKYDKNPVKNLKSTAISFYEENKFIKGQVRYLNITYDKVNNIYYRLVALPVENDVDLTSKDKAFLVSPLVIMVLDAEFNVLAEKELEPYLYNYQDYFVNEEGFWLSNNNPKNPNFNEDEFKFSLFTLKK